METLESAPSHSAIAEEQDAIFAPEAASAPTPWHPLTRLGFRIAFIYFCGFMYLYGSDGIDFNSIVMWRGIGNFLNWPLNQLLIWSGHHIFHVKNMPPHWHVADRGDALGNWILVKLLIVGSILGGLLWTGIARRRGSQRTEYNTLLAWLRFLLRLTVGFFMVGYGMLKVFPLQMPPISLALLNQPAGQMTPHALLWSMVGLYPAYESICGVVEVIAGALVLFRRTALAGALLCVFVMSNVVLYNFFFGVSVKLFALNLTLAAIFIVLPDVKPLLDFFWKHQAAAQTSVWTPPLTNRGLRLYVRFLEVLFIVVSFTVNPLFDGIIWQHSRNIARIQSPLLGAWRFDSTHPASGPFVTPKGPGTEVYIDTVERGMTRSADGALWRTFLKIDPTKHTVYVSPFVGRDVTYKWQMPDANHLILTTMPADGPALSAKGKNPAKPEPAFVPVVVSLVRIPLPTHYPLFDSKFRLVSYY
ncbi:MAG: hypothetical protein WCE63_11440 [Acidobacteriaceae bacterium]